MDESLSSLVAPLLDRLIDEGGALHVVVVDGAGRIVRANAAMTRSLGGAAVGKSLDEVTAEGCRAAIAAHARDGGRFLLQLVRSDGPRRSLVAYARPHGDGYLVVAEAAADGVELEERVLSLNTELAVLAREVTRKSRALEDAHRELQDAHWHIRKIAKVLPICMKCHAVRNADGSWEDLAQFLARHSDFLSHGLCAPCADRMMEELELEP